MLAVPPPTLRRAVTGQVAALARAGPQGPGAQQRVMIDVGDRLRRLCREEPACGDFGGAEPGRR